LIVVRVIKSFSFRVVKNLVLPHVDLTTTTVGELKKQAKEGAVNRKPLTIEIQKQSHFRPFRNVEFGITCLFMLTRHDKNIRQSSRL
jgi:hypothetical protein